MRYSDRVEPDGAGGYQWSYDPGAHGNRRPLWQMLAISGAVWAVIAIALLAVAGGRYLKDALIFVLGTGAGIVGLPALIWLLIPTVLDYHLTEAYIEAWPKGRSSGIHRFQYVRRVTLRPDKDEIYLRFALGGLQILVPPEDYDLVLKAIQDKVPPGTEIQHDW